MINKRFLIVVLRVAKDPCKVAVPTNVVTPSGAQRA
jgi:hypothetical protein